MRAPLKKFTDYTNSLLPNETEYLLSVQKFEDDDRLNILRQVDYNTHHIEQFTPYNINYDKRKYNHLQNWMQKRLQEIDVDENFKQLLDWEQKIANDTILLPEEKQLLKSIRNHYSPNYNFSKFYELVSSYRHFLLIRMRYSDHQLVDKFIKNHEASYLQSREIKNKLHRATLSIVDQYSNKSGDSKQWGGWLSEVFYNEEIEGHIRYLALVRLVFICHNYRNYDLLKDKLEYLDKKFSEGKFYSKRILLNYYNIRLMLHSHMREYNKAVYYGYLSVRANTHDQLLYVNNLCAILLRLNRNQEALQLMKASTQEAQKTSNFHNRIGFVSFYMESLNKNGLGKNAEQYGNSFLKAYAKEIIQYRWHLFFSVYLEIMFHLGQFEKILSIARKYRLTEKEREYQSDPNYLPFISIYIIAAKFRDGRVSKNHFSRIIKELLSIEKYNRNTTFRNFIDDIKIHLPEIMAYI